MATMKPKPHAALCAGYEPAWPEDVKFDKVAQRPIVIAIVVWGWLDGYSDGSGRGIHTPSHSASGSRR